MSMGNYQREAATAFATRLTMWGFRVFVAKSGTHGIITDKTGSRVLSFSFTDGSLGGNYGPPSRESGTGWRMDATPAHLTSAAAVRDALYAPAPLWAGKGWRHYTTLAQMLDVYGQSSGLVEFEA